MINLASWIRTSDLGITDISDYSPPLYQLSYSECAYMSLLRKKERQKVLPGFEPGLLDSKSRVITNYTIEPMMYIYTHERK